MEPWLQYATTSDGVNIAYALAGSGPPLVRITGGLWDHAQGYWRVTPMRRQLERLCTHFTHIQYDARGTGLSQRGVADFRLEAQLRDLEAVVEASQLDQFNLLGHFTGGFAAMSYAALNPERVSRLVLFRPHLRGSDYFNDRVIRALDAYRKMAAEDWWGYLGTVTNRAMRFERPDIARQMMAVYDESMTPETILRFEQDYKQIDVTDVPERIVCPTLIVVESERSGFSEDAWREVASLIPNVSLVMVRAEMPLAHMDEVTDAILSFLQEEKSGRMAPAAEALQVLLFMSVSGAPADYETVLREMVRARGAVSFFRASGGFVAGFRSAQMALETARDLQQAFTGQGDPAKLRIGADAVDQTSAEAEPEAASDTRAARAARAAEEGEVLVTDVVRQLVTGKGFAFLTRSERLDQGSDEPVTLHELRWRT